MTAPAFTPQSTLAALKGSMPPMRRPALSQERPRARRRPCLLLALLPMLLAGPQPAALAGSTDLEASYRFLTSERAKGVQVPISAPPSTAAEAATARLESLWEKAQRLTPFGKDDDE